MQDVATEGVGILKGTAPENLALKLLGLKHQWTLKVYETKLN